MSDVTQHDVINIELIMNFPSSEKPDHIKSNFINNNVILQENSGKKYNYQ